VTPTVLAAATVSALASVPGATVTVATPVTADTTAGAGFTVHLTTSGGEHLVVTEDPAFTVLSVGADLGASV
jgi:hypothetical protein